MGFDSIGKFVIIVGIITVLLGLIMTFGGKIGLGKLPGDIYFSKGNFSFYFPLATSIILSIVLTIILNFFSRR